jgi:hypothetical protein
VIAFSLRIEARVLLTCFSGENFNRWFRHQLNVHKHWACVLFLWGPIAYFTWRDSPTKIRDRFLTILRHSSNSPEQILLQHIGA